MLLDDTASTAKYDWSEPKPENNYIRRIVGDWKDIQCTTSEFERNVQGETRNAFRAEVLWPRLQSNIFEIHIIALQMI
jgi:hypothetical protein